MDSCFITRIMINNIYNKFPLKIHKIIPDKLQRNNSQVIYLKQQHATIWNKPPDILFVSASIDWMIGVGFGTQINY